MYVMVGVVNENKLVIDELVSMTVGIIPPEKCSKLLRTVRDNWASVREPYICDFNAAFSL